MDIKILLKYAKQGKDFREKLIRISNENMFRFTDAFKDNFNGDITDEQSFPEISFLFILWILHDPNKAKELKYNWSANGYGFLFLENFGYLIKNDLFIGIFYDVIVNRKILSNYASETNIDNILTQGDTFCQSIESFLISPLDYKKKIIDGLPIWYVGLAIKKFYEITQIIEDEIYKAPIVEKINKNTMYTLADSIFKEEFSFFGLTKLFYRAGSTLNDNEKKEIEKMIENDKPTSINTFLSAILKKFEVVREIPDKYIYSSFDENPEETGYTCDKAIFNKTTKVNLKNKNYDEIYSFIMSQTIEDLNYLNNETTAVRTLLLCAFIRKIYLGAVNTYIIQVGEEADIYTRLLGKVDNIATIFNLDKLKLTQVKQYFPTFAAFYPGFVERQTKADFLSQVEEKKRMIADCLQVMLTEREKLFEIGDIVNYNKANLIISQQLVYMQVLNIDKNTYQFDSIYRAQNKELIKLALSMNMKKIRTKVPIHFFVSSVEKHLLEAKVEEQQAAVIIQKYRNMFKNFNLSCFIKTQICKYCSFGSKLYSILYPDNLKKNEQILANSFKNLAASNSNITQEEIKNFWISASTYFITRNSKNLAAVENFTNIIRKNYPVIVEFILIYDFFKTQIKVNTTNFDDNLEINANNTKDYYNTEKKISKNEINTFFDYLNSNNKYFKFLQTYTPKQENELKLIYNSLKTIKLNDSINDVFEQVKNEKNISLQQPFYMPQKSYHPQQTYPLSQQQARTQPQQVYQQTTPQTYQQDISEKKESGFKWNFSNVSSIVGGTITGIFSGTAKGIGYVLSGISANKNEIVSSAKNLKYVFDNVKKTLYDQPENSDKITTKSDSLDANLSTNSEKKKKQNMRQNEQGPDPRNLNVIFEEPIENINQ